eukprot:scaffold2193_cov171-Amphora_coffeaeformis.AAC.9
MVVENNNNNNNAGKKLSLTNASSQFLLQSSSHPRLRRWKEEKVLLAGGNWDLPNQRRDPPPVLARSSKTGRLGPCPTGFQHPASADVNEKITQTKKGLEEDGDLV